MENRKKTRTILGELKRDFFKKYMVFAFKSL